MSNMQSGEVFWTVHGDFITDLAREKMIDSYRKAYQFLHDSFPTMTINQINDILKGEKRLTGINDLEYENELDDVKEKYQTEMEAKYNSFFYKDGKYYHPYMIVTSYGWKDKDARPERAWHYTSSNDIVFNSKLESYICKEVVVDLPLWIEDNDLTFENCIEHCTLMETGHDIVYPELRTINNPDTPYFKDVDTKETRALDEFLANIKKEAELDIPDLVKQIKEQAKADGWIDIEDIDGKVVGSVPKAPFYHWVSRETGVSYEIKQDILPNWECISPAGLKMYNDNRYHTDWMLGGGFNLENDGDYNSDSEITKASYHMKSKLQREIFGFECTVLTNTDSGVISGRIFKADDDRDLSEIEEGDILLIPNAGIKYTEAFLKATSKGCGGVICEYGSKVAHLCKISREQDVMIVQDDKAMSKYMHGAYVRINGNIGKIEVNW